MQAAFLLLSCGEGRVVILRQRGSAMLNLPTLAFYSSLFPKFSASLYPLLLSQSSLLPNHLSRLGSPPTSQTKLRIPCCPLSKSAQKIPANPLALCLRSAYPPPISILLPSQSYFPALFRSSNLSRTLTPRLSNAPTSRALTSIPKNTP